MIELFLTILLVVCILAKNVPITIAVILVLALKILNCTRLMAYIDSYGVTVAIVILMAAVLVPVVDGKVTTEQLQAIFRNKTAILSILVGIFVSYLGGQGVEFMKTQPLFVPGLIMGTVIGVLVFGGVPVGPIIAAGMTALIAEGFSKLF